ncbi:aminotransferase class I/II-fold pyridoxal phosphate-dependent enzyme [Streptacidiphilus sp. EB129]|jgi:aspartate/methionine/tyrosine aminotransferase|uniref:aminotransferase class I/II-fold pyridoxal phosphate-dependent enzyme n=1 Tax=Streptacidiphilus sp. EB129 TaxID=3156262 RepID=UPI0035184AC6
MTQALERAPEVALTYPMRKWVFEDSLGRYDIDLGDSHVQCGTMSQLHVPADLELNYGVDRGSPDLIELVADRYLGSSDRVIVTHGAQEALYLLYCTLLKPGDRVIAFRPGWQQAWDVPEKLGCDVRVLNLAEDFSIDLETLREAAGPNLRLITVNTPSNPTGRRIRHREFEALCAVAEESDAYILLDEEYVLDLATSPALRGDRFVSVSSLSKMYGFPGLRVGWMYGPPEVVSACAEYKHLTSIANSVLCEHLAVDVLQRWQEWARQYHRLTDEGLHILTQWCEQYPDQLRLVTPEGTPFAWIHLTTGESSLSFARRVLDTGVLVMPAETLGASRGLRLAFARDPQILHEGLRRIGEVLATTPEGSFTS